MDAIQAILTRRSTRRFRPDPVEEEKLSVILNAARQAPSGGNNQTCHFLVIRDRQVMDKLASMAEKAFAAMEVKEDTYSSLRAAILASKRGGYVFHYGAPLLIAVANQVDYGNNLPDVACALENMMVAANALDLGSCWVNQLRWLNEDPDLTEYLCSLGLKEGERIYGGVVIGNPDTPDGLPARNLMKRKGNEVTFIG
jgi:nitroreductase